MPLLIVAEQGRIWGWGSGRALLCYAIGVIGLIAFIFAERAYKDDALLPLRMFKNRSFAVSSVGSIVLGAGMFGGILLLPQYLQIVHGSSPTVAGLQMIPLVAGIMTGAMGSGIAIGKTGKYKIYPLVGIVFIVAALVSMSLIIDADTSVWTLAPFMVLLGLGLGFNFQPVILAVQNAVRPQEMGVATSSVTFFRQMGGTIGVAAFLSILFTTLPNKISDAFTSAAATDPRVAQALQSGQLKGSGDLSDTSFIQKLPDFLATPFKTGFSDSIDLVFLVAAAVVAIGFFVMLFLPEVPLRNQSGIQAQQSGAGEITGTGTATGDETAADDAVRAVGAAAPTSVSPADATAAGDGIRGDGIRGDGILSDGIRGDGIRGDGIRGDGILATAPRSASTPRVTTATAPDRCRPPRAASPIGEAALGACGSERWRIVDHRRGERRGRRFRFRSGCCSASQPGWSGGAGDAGRSGDVQDAVGIQDEAPARSECLQPVVTTTQAAEVRAVRVAAARVWDDVVEIGPPRSPSAVGKAAAPVSGMDPLVLITRGRIGAGGPRTPQHGTSTVAVLVLSASAARQTLELRA